MKKIEEARQYLREMGLDGWLLYDFHKNNALAHTFLEIPESQMVTRRFFYWIPVEGECVKIVHAIETHILDAWPGEKRIFLSWQSMEAEVKRVLAGKKRIAMEFSPRNRVPYVSKVDGGTCDLVRSFGVEIVSSGTFLPHFTAVLDEKQVESHKRAAKLLDAIVNDAWRWIAECLRKKKPIDEYAVQQKILGDFEKQGLVTDSWPIVGVNAHSADPHYEPKETGSSPIHEGDFILIDLWAKESWERAVFGDITRVAVASDRATEKQEKVFQIVKEAQKAGIEFVKARFREKRQVLGCEIDDVVRKVIVDAGFGPNFLHRTGHSIEIALHGSGASIDNLEVSDDRPILPGTCFSIEPGIYLKGDFGVRLETDVYVDLAGEVHVTGGFEEELLLLKNV